MNKQTFENLIQLITGKNLSVNENFIELNSEYSIFLNDVYNFTFKTPKKLDSLLSSFINQYCNKFKEVMPKYLEMFKFKHESMYMKHHLKSKYTLLDEIKENFNKDAFLIDYCKYGFYTTDYGIGIFVQYLTDRIFTNMENFLNLKKIPYSLEYSEKEFVLRFKIKVNKDFHNNLLNEFNNIK